MPLRCPPHAPFFFPTHIGCIVYSLHSDLNLRAKIDGNGPILMKLRLGEVWCCDDEFRSQHSSSHSFINIGLMLTYYLYNCSLWYHVSSYESRSRYHIGVVFKMSTQHGGTSAAALSWLLAEYGSLVCGVWLAYLIFVHRSGQMVSFRWNFSSAKLAIRVEYDIINSTLCTTIPPVETREWCVVFDCLRLLYVRNWYLICGIGRASVSFATKLVRISRKYHFGGIFPLIRKWW